MFNLFRFELRLRRGAIIGWGIGLAGFAMMYLMFYPSIEEQFGDIDLSTIAIYQALGEMSMASLQGYFASTVLNFLPIIFSVYAVIAGTAALAGDEEAGTLELLAAMPLKRWQIVIAKALALTVSGVLIIVMGTLGTMLAVNIVGSQVETDLTGLDVLPAVLNTLPVGLVFMMFSLFMGAYLPARRMASAVGTVAIIGSFLASNLAGTVEALEPLKPFLPFTYHDATAAVLTEGVKAGDVFTLLAAALIFLILAVLSFNRRNLTVGAWPWQKSKGT